MFCAKNTGVGSLPLLQGIFPIQELNWGLLHFRQILYQLSHKGSPRTGVGSLSLLQGIFPIQELNWGLLHCRWILCQLSCQGCIPKYAYHTCCLPGFHLSARKTASQVQPESAPVTHRSAVGPYTSTHPSCLSATQSGGAYTGCRVPASPTQPSTTHLTPLSSPG